MKHKEPLWVKIEGVLMPIGLVIVWAILIWIGIKSCGRPITQEEREEMLYP